MNKELDYDSRSLRYTRAIAFVLILACLIGCVFFAGTTYSWFSDEDMESTVLKDGEIRYAPSMKLSEEENLAYGKIMPAATDGSITYIYMGKEMLVVPKTSDGALINNSTDRALKMRNFSTVDSNVRLGFYVTLTSGEAIRELEWQQGSVPDIWQCGEIVEGKFIPIFSVTLSSGSALGRTYRWVKVDDAERTPFVTSTGSIQWNLEVKKDGDVDFKTAVPSKDSFGDSEANLFRVVESIKLVEQVPEGITEEDFGMRFMRKDMRIKIGYFARQAEYMEWSNWPETYEYEVMY